MTIVLTSVTGGAEPTPVARVGGVRVAPRPTLCVRVWRGVGGWVVTTRLRALWALYSIVDVRLVA